MNINGLSQFGESVQPLQNLYKNSGNCVMNGFLGEGIKDLSFDDEGRIIFSTHKEFDEETVDSDGVVLSDSILLKQVQKSPEVTSYRLYSWDVDESRYTFMSFDNSHALNQFFDRIKKFDVSLCDDDVSTLFQEMGLTFESVTQILLNQKRDPMKAMFDEETAVGESHFSK